MTEFSNYIMEKQIMQKLVILDIPKTGECPQCRHKHDDWTPYAIFEDGEIGIFCPICCAHYKDEELSLEEFGLIE